MMKMKKVRFTQRLPIILEYTATQETPQQQ
jgi:hypothetical protein